MTRYDIDFATGEIVLEEASPPGPWDVACGEVPWGLPRPGGGMVLRGLRGSSDLSGRRRPAPRWCSPRPTSRSFRTNGTWKGAGKCSGALLAGRPVPQSVEEELEDYRATPKKYFLSTGAQLVDDANRWWIATQRDTHEWSYLDVYENAEYLGSVKVRDRLRAFDLAGSTLVVLAERRVGPDDTDGIPDRALDWYDVGDLPFGG